MAQRIIVQDGIVLYAASDPLNDVNFSVNGNVNLTKQLSVGNGPTQFSVAADGSIQLAGSSGTIGQALVSQGNGAPPIWSTPAAAPSAPITINSQPGNYIAQLSDANNTLIRMTSSSANVLTIPEESSVNFPIGTSLLISQNGTGQTTISPAGGVTIVSPYTTLVGIQYGKVTAIKTASNYWELEGNLQP